MSKVIEMPIKLPTVYPPHDFPEGDPPPGPDPVVQSSRSRATIGGAAVAEAAEEPYRLVNIFVGAEWKGHAGDLCRTLRALPVPENASALEVSHIIRDGQHMLRRIVLNGPQGLHVMKQ